LLFEKSDGDLEAASVIDQEAALLADVRFALRDLNSSEEYAWKVVEYLKLCGWDIYRPLPKQTHST
jgi:hypothetical protein